MLDQSKRHTLKILGVTPLVAMPAFAAAGSFGAINNIDNASTISDLPGGNQSSSMPLQIQILDTSAVPDNNVLLRNTSDEALHVDRFMPGHIFFKDQIMDLNEAIGEQSLVLQPGQSKAFDFKLWPVLNAGPIEYVWADQAMEKLNDNTSIVTLGAFMAGTDAVVYANTNSYALS